MSENAAFDLFGFRLCVDPDLPPDTIKLICADTHLVKIEGERAEFVGGPLDGIVLDDDSQQG